MNDTTVARRLIDKSFDSTLEGVDAAEVVAGYAARLVGFGEVDRRRICLVIRTAMLNAVGHGNHFNRNKKVALEIWEHAKRGIVVEVKDEGEGIDTERAAFLLGSGRSKGTASHGFEIMGALMDDVQVELREPSGTRVRMVKYCTS